MLNAFRHQRKGHPFRLASYWRSGLCAQRLSASTEGSPGTELSLASAGPCAQRLSASTEGSRDVQSEGRHHRLVLNAFRHQRKGHHAARSRANRSAECSTPFGINGRVTCRRPPCCCDLSSAQRLSASTEGSLACSGGGDSDRCVLNAFRHQRKGHMACWFAPVQTGGAQRLSASTEGSPAAGPDGRRDRVVLNAFRHQRKGHVVSLALSPLATNVLNAFRHQRKGHFLSLRPLTIGRVCSTPFGINGRVTSCTANGTLKGSRAQRLSASTEGSPRANQHCESGCSVLNAFRHQRKGHMLFDALDDIAGRCSTPFGINGRVTCACHSKVFSAQECSTPFGINGRVTRSARTYIR